MEELILHGIGDYFLQTDKQALSKKNKGWYGFWQCFIHCLTYSLPFYLIGNTLQVSMIFLTHFIIDRTNIVAWGLAYKNGIRTIENFGFGLQRPFAITIWLYIICDNLIHIICNYLILKYL
jgi:Protein of unknown function (DUF3307)